MTNTITGLDWTIELAIWLPIAFIIAIIIYSLVSRKEEA